MQVTIQIAVVLLDVCRAWTNETRISANSCEECDAKILERLQDEQISASICDSWNCNFRSNSFVRAPSLGGGSNVPRPDVFVPHIDVNADRRWAKQARSALFFILGAIRRSYAWILAYVELEWINKGQHFQIGVISKLASKFLPDDEFFMDASKRLPYHSYYCCVSFPFVSVGIV